MKYTIANGILGYVVQYHLPNPSRLFTIASNNGLSAGQAEAIAWALNHLHEAQLLYKRPDVWSHIERYTGSTEGI